MATSDIARDSISEREQTSTEVASCPECNGSLREEQGETYCTECGLIVDEDHLDRGPEWSIYDENERRRTGAPLTETRHDRGLSTEIGRKTDGYGRTLPGSKRRQLGRIRLQHSRARWRSKAEQNLANGFLEVTRIASALDLADSIIERACVIFRDAQEEDLLVGLSIEAIAAASVFAACRCLGLPVLFDEFVDYSPLEASQIRTAYQKVNFELGLKTKPMTSQIYVPRFAAALDVPDRVRYHALELADHLEESGAANGCTPTGAAAACLYHAGREHAYPLTQEEAAAAAHVTPPTPRKHLDILRTMSLDRDHTKNSSISISGNGPSPREYQQ